jgi:hypothetical protein
MNPLFLRWFCHSRRPAKWEDAPDLLAGRVAVAADMAALAAHKAQVRARELVGVSAAS